MNVDHEKGYCRLSASPIVAPGASGAWDDHFVYACAVTKVSGVYHLFYGGGRNVGVNPRLEMEVGLATSPDGVTWTKQGRVIPKSTVSPANGFAPFSILEIDGVWHLFGTVLQVAAPIYRCAYFTSTDLLNWSGPTFMSGLTAQSHAPCVIEDPSDPSKLILYFTKMNDFLNQRAVANKSNPAAWSGLSQVAGFTAIYPNVRYVDGEFETVFAKPRSENPQKYLPFMTRTTDGLTFKDASGPVIQYGASGSFDQYYVTTPFLFEDMLFWSGRGTSDNDGYRGIGCAKLSAVGGVHGWDWYTGAIGKSSVAHTGTYGALIAYSALGAGTLNANGKGRDKVYTVWMYDDLEGTIGFQNTFRLVPTADAITVPQLTVGAIPSVSGSKYICRVRNGSWVTTGINRSIGWHKLTFEVGDDVVMKIDDVSVATDTAFDTAAPFTVTVQGGTYGTLYADDFSVSDL